MFAFSQIEPRQRGMVTQADIPMSKYLGAAFEQGIHDQMFASVYRMEEMNLARQGDMIDAETANKQFALPNLKFTEPVYREEAQLIYNRKKAEGWRDYVLSEGSTSVTRAALSFPVSMVANMLSPVDLAMAFVPIAKVPVAANVLGRGAIKAAMPTLTRGVIGVGGKGLTHRLSASVIEGTVGNAIAEIPLLASNSQDMTQYTASDSMFNILAGGVFAAGLRLSLEGAGRTLRRLFPETRAALEREAANKFLRDEVVDHLQKVAALDKNVIAHDIKTHKAYGEAEARAEVDDQFRRILEEPDHMKQAKEIFDMPTDEFSARSEGFNTLTDSIGVAIGKMNVPATQLQLAQMMSWVSDIRKKWNALLPEMDKLSSKEAFESPIFKEWTALGLKGQFFSEIIEVAVGMKPEYVRKHYPNYVAQFSKADVSPELITTERERRMKQLLDWKKSETLGMNAPHDNPKAFGPERPAARESVVRYRQKLPRGVTIRGLESITELPPAVGSKIEDVHKEIQKIDDQVEELKAEQEKTKEITTGKTDDKIEDVTSQSRRGFLSTLGKALAAVGVTPASVLKGGAKKYYMIHSMIGGIQNDIPAGQIHTDPTKLLASLKKAFAQYSDRYFRLGEDATDSSIDAQNDFLNDTGMDKFLEWAEKHGIENTFPFDDDFRKFSELQDFFFDMDPDDFTRIMIEMDPMLSQVEGTFSIMVAEHAGDLDLKNPADVKKLKFTKQLDLVQELLKSLPSEASVAAKLKDYVTSPASAFNRPKPTIPEGGDLPHAKEKSTPTESAKTEVLDPEERITSTAQKIQGKVVVGDMPNDIHWTIIDQELTRRGINTEDEEGMRLHEHLYTEAGAGFMTSKGRFVGREEAARISGTSQVERKFDSAYMTETGELQPEIVKRMKDVIPYEPWFHGRSGPVTFDPDRPAFFTKKKEDAQWYAVNRGEGTPNITEAQLEMKKSADLTDLQEAIRAAQAKGVDVDAQIRKLTGYGGLVENEHDALYVPEVIEELRAKGFDSYQGSDVFMNDEIDIAVVFGPDQIKEPKTYASKIDELEIAANCLLFNNPMTVGFKLPRGVKIKGIKER